MNKIISVSDINVKIFSDKPGDIKVGEILGTNNNDNNYLKKYKIKIMTEYF